MKKKVLSTCANLVKTRTKELHIIEHTIDACKVNSRPFFLVLIQLSFVKQSIKDKNTFFKMSTENSKDQSEQDDKGTFTNYVDMILALLTTYPPPLTFSNL